MSAREVLARIECRRCYIAAGGYMNVDKFVDDWWSNHTDVADKQIAALAAAGYEIRDTRPLAEQVKSWIIDPANSECLRRMLNGDFRMNSGAVAAPPATPTKAGD